MFRKIFSMAIILLCLGFISCGEINKPILPEYPPPETFFDGPIRITCNHTEYSGSTAWGGFPVSKISRVLVESDIIFVGKSIKVSGNGYNNEVNEVDIEIIEVLKGATNEKRATLVGSAAIAYDFYEGNVFIIFIRKDIRKDGDVFIFPTATNRIGRHSVIVVEDHFRGNIYNNGTPFCNYEDLDDIKLLLNAYKKNKELFSKEGKGKKDLFSLYPQLKGFEVKSRVLDEVEYLLQQYALDKEDIPILLKWIEIETNDNLIRQIQYILNYLIND